VSESGSCDDGHCVTCSDEAAPMRVLAIRDESTALCEGDVVVMTELVGSVGPGDELLVHAGTAIARVSE
jgi:hydrogenase maturation factor